VPSPAALVAVRATPTSLKRKRQGGKVSGKKSNKAHVKKRKFLRMGLALVDSEGSGTTRLTKKGSKATQKQHAFKTIGGCAFVRSCEGCAALAPAHSR
jgi:hypothetical protein